MHEFNVYIYIYIFIFACCDLNNDQVALNIYMTNVSKFYKNFCLILRC